MSGLTPKLYNWEWCQIHWLCSNKALSFYCSCLVLRSLGHASAWSTVWSTSEDYKYVFSFFRNWKHMLIIQIWTMNIIGKLLTAFPRKRERDKNEREKNLKGCYKNWNLYWVLKLQKQKDRNGNSCYSATMVSIAFKNLCLSKTG